jgi:hypothetical protein
VRHSALSTGGIATDSYPEPDAAADKPDAAADNRIIAQVLSLGSIMITLNENIDRCNVV